MGRIANHAKSVIPISWDALAQDQQRAGDATLDIREEYVQTRIFGEKLSSAAEDALNILVIEYAGKRLALDIAGVDLNYWMDVAQDIQSHGPYERKTYPERLEYLKLKRATLITEIAELEPVVAPMIPTVQAARSGSAPLLSSIDDEMLTPNVNDLGPAYGQPTR